MAAPDWVNEKMDMTFPQEVVGLIERASGEKPFVLYLASSGPHSAHMFPGFAVGKSEAARRGDMVCLADWSLGQVTEALEAAGVAEDTRRIHCCS